MGSWSMYGNQDLLGPYRELLVAVSNRQSNMKEIRLVEIFCIHKYMNLTIF